MAADQPGDLAVTLMADIYDRESARRVAPDHQFDTELDAALDRLERQTTPEDRELVRSIGERLHRLGGENALRGARERMLAEQRSGRPELRASIIDRRWAGVGRGA